MYNLQLYKFDICHYFLRIIFQQTINIVKQDWITDVRVVFIESPHINVNSGGDLAENDESGLRNDKRQQKVKLICLFQIFVLTVLTN